MNFNDGAIVSVKGNDYRIQFLYISKDKAIKISCEKNHDHFIGYMDDDYEIKPLCIMFPKLTTYVKSIDGDTKWLYIFFWKWWIIKKNIMIFEVKSARV